MKKLSLVVLALLVTISLAQDDNPIDVILEAFIVSEVKQDDGTIEEVFTEASQARPGQVVEYRITATNVSELSLPEGNAVITGPIPETTTYLADSATMQNASLEFSADGGQSFSVPPVMITVTNDDGEEEEVEASPEQYTAARWIVLAPLAPDEMMTFVYRVVVK